MTYETDDGSRFSELRTRNFKLRIAPVSLESGICALVCRHPAMTVTSSISHRGQNVFSLVRVCSF